MFLYRRYDKEKIISLRKMLIFSMFLVFSFPFSASVYADDISESFNYKTNQTESSLEKVQIKSIELLDVTPFYEKKEFPLRKIGSIAPQEVTVLKQVGNSFFIKTWLGDYWINPKKYIDENGITKLQLDKPYAIYNSHSLNSKTSLIVSPQVVTLVEESDSWWKIKTWVGDKYLYKNEGEKIAYITFDDGPSEHTDDVLKILKEHNAKATFFMLEPNMRKYSNLVKQMVQEGHFTAFHSVTHDKHKLYGGNPYNPVKEMEKGRETLKKITGEDHFLVRMPYGSIPYMKSAFRDALVEYHFKMWDWTIDSYDWKYSIDDSSNILLNVKNQLEGVERRGEPVVILFHGQPQTVKALPEVIKFLYQQGYQLKAYHPDEHIIVNFWDDTRL